MPMLPGEAPLPAAVDDLQLSNLDYSLEMSRVLGKIISEDCDDFLFEDHRNTVSEFNPQALLRSSALISSQPSTSRDNKLLAA